MILALLLTSFSAMACPEGAPSAFLLTEGQKERAYHDKEKTVSVVVKCDPKVKSADALKALEILGEPQKVNERVSYVDVKPGMMRIYVGKQKGSDTATQLAVVAKTPEALSKASPALVEYLQK